MEQRFLYQVKLKENLFPVDDPGRRFHMYISPAGIGLCCTIVLYLAANLRCSCKKGWGAGYLFYYIIILYPSDDCTCGQMNSGNPAVIDEDCRMEGFLTSPCDHARQCILYPPAGFKNSVIRVGNMHLPAAILRVSDLPVTMTLCSKSKK